MFELKWTKQVVFDSANPENCVLDMCEPVTDEKVPLFIFFHGGGLEVGTQEIYAALQNLAQKHGIAVASPAYRMYPEAKFPDFVEDAAKAIAFLEKEYHISEKYSKIVVGGSSAGGYLSLMLCFAKHFLQAVGVDEKIIHGWIFNAGQPTSHFRVLKERGFDGRCVRVDEDAPLYYITESFANKHTVPVLIMAADHDMVNRLEQNVMLKTALLHFDYPENQVALRVMENYRHCQYDNAQDADGKYVFAEIIAEFINGLKKDAGD